MAITQQTYTERIGKARNGQIANMHTCDVDPYIVEGANGIGWGVAVQRGSSQNKVKVGIDALSFLGIAVLDPTQTESEGGGTKYPAGSHAGILYRGDMFIAPFEAVRAGDIVTVRASDGRLGKSRGGVRTVRVVEGGSGYNNATVVDVDEPEFGDGVQAVQIAAGAVTVGAGGTITAIAPRNAANERGSGYGRPPALRPTVGSGAILVAEMDFVMIPDAVWQEDIAAGGIGLVSFGGYRTGAHS